MDTYLDIFISTVLMTGAMFELPVLFYFLARFRIVTAKWMLKYWRHATIAILIFSAFFTPGDVVVTTVFFSVVLLAPLLRVRRRGLAGRAEAPEGLRAPHRTRARSSRQAPTDRLGSGRPPRRIRAYHPTGIPGSGPPAGPRESSPWVGGPRDPSAARARAFRS